ncbi:MAG: undecaprenyl-phosphate galactose phosphotransferase WbaP [Desulfovibrionaceae bacterium]|nr:undecaprenyl-phosphate galactose phosphotransferase WbaP [Desulfovibrionaceae bacterium]
MNSNPFIIRCIESLNIAPQKMILAASDFVALLLTAVLVYVLRTLTGGLDPQLYTVGLPLLLLAPLLGVLLGLYQSIPLTPHRELRALCNVITIIYALLLALLFFSKSSSTISRLFLAGAWLCSMVSVPLLRAFLRKRFARQPWWGIPLLIFDGTTRGKTLWHWLKRHPQRGLRPVDRLPLPQNTEDLRLLCARLSALYPKALVLLPFESTTNSSLDYLSEISNYFNGVLLIPLLPEGQEQHWFSVRDLGTNIGFLVRHNLRDRKRQFIKRTIDLTLTLSGMVIIVPLGLLLSLAIILSSPGSPIYTQKRIGRGGKVFTVYKFRTMVPNADTILQQYLAKNPSLQAEWERDHKLKKDPRIFRVGALLRKTSLDEFPQLWNVLCGDMSLVGPRPIVEAEIEKYGHVFNDYCRVRPGITGLWQISGRNNTTYQERVQLDRYYVNNWSVWLDIWILAKTFPVVVMRDGAY